MHLVFVNGHFPQTTQTFVLNHIDHALTAGNEVTIWCRLMEPGIAHPVIDKWDLYGRLIYAAPRDAAVRRRVALGALRRPLRFARGLALRLTRKINRTEFLFLMQLGRAPDVFVANFGPSGIPAAKLKRFVFPKARLAVIFHGYDMSLYVNEFGWHRYRLIADDIDLPVAVSATWARLLEEQAGLNAVTVHHLGVPVAAIPPWRGHDGPEFRLLFVGRLTEKKGLPVLLEAMRALVDAGRAVTLRVAGDGPQVLAMRELIAALALGDHVTLLGNLTHAEILRLLAESDCFVAPSVTARNGDAEGIPVTLMEAMACGVPVVSTWHSGIPELVEDGVSGLLAPQRDPEALAQAIGRIMDDPDLRGRLAAAGQARVRRDFDSARQNPVLFDMIQALPGAHPADDPRSGGSGQVQDGTVSSY